MRAASLKLLLNSVGSKILGKQLERRGTLACMLHENLLWRYKAHLGKSERIQKLDYTSADFLRKYTAGKDEGKITLLTLPLISSTMRPPRGLRCNIWVPTIMI